MASLAGAELPAGLELDGVNLLPMLLDNKQLPQRALFWRYVKERAVRKGPWKLLVQGENARLHNLTEDLGEKKNLAQAKPEIVKALEDELAAWESDVLAGVELKA
jgi:arylsulfatase A-like enzyme